MSDVPIGASCNANIAMAGIRRRRRFGWVSAVIGVGLAAVCVATGAPWYARLALFLPAAAAANGFLQASRQTCVGHARMGTVEAEDFSMTKASAEELVESRKVASGILRDASVVGALAAVVGAASAVIH